MRLTCTACGAHGSIETFAADVEARRFAELVATLPGGVAPVAVRYLGLFRPAKRGLTWDRAVKLLSQLAEMLAAGGVERRGKLVRAEAATFVRAMQQMLDTRERIELPLTGHGYLVAIVAGEAPKDATVAEAAVEELRRSGQRAGQNSEARLISEIAAQMATRKRLQQAPFTEAELDALKTRLRKELEA